MSGAAALPVLMHHLAPESGSGSLLAVPRDLIDRSRRLCVPRGGFCAG